MSIRALLVILATWLPACRTTEEVEPVVREAVLAGRWYPADAAELSAVVEGHLDAAAEPPLPVARVRALVVPHAGYRWSGDVAGRAYAAVRGGNYRRVVVLAPSHHVAFRGVALSDAMHYETPLGRVAVDREACDVLLDQPGYRTVPEAHGPEHAIEIQLPFLQVALGDFELVPCLVGEQGREDDPRLAEALRPLLDANTLLVVSSDFTHYGSFYGYQPFDGDVPARLRALDLGIIDTILACDPEAFRQRIDDTRATVCGRRPIGLALHLLSDDVRGTRLAYRTSAELDGNYSASIGYAALVFTAPAPLAEE